MSFLATWRFWPRSLTTRWKLRQRWREIAKITREGRTWKQKDLILCCQIYPTEGAGNEKIKMLIERSNPFEREMYLHQELILLNLSFVTQENCEEIDKKMQRDTTFIMGLIWCLLETKCTSGTIHFKQESCDALYVAPHVCRILHTHCTVKVYWGKLSNKKMDKNLYL